MKPMPEMPPVEGPRCPDCDGPTLIRDGERVCARMLTMGLVAPVDA